MATGHPAWALSNRELISEITGAAARLVRKEIALARAEVRADLQAQLTAATTLAVAAVAALIGLNLLAVAAVLALGLVIAGWLAALVVAGVLLAAAAIAGYLGWRRMVRTPLARTRQTLREDVRWLRRRLA
jgi:hypothetical protein